MRGGWIYILANRKQGALFTGVTADLPSRMMQHRYGTASKFCVDYGIHKLMHAEWHDRARKGHQAVTQGLEDRTDRIRQP